MSFGIFAEQWRPVDGFDGYEVSNAGRVASYLKTGRRGFRYAVRRVLKPQVDRDGYLRFAIRRQGKQVHRLGHRLVLEAFVGPCPTGMEGRHLNGVRSANWLHNLRWSTHVINVGDKTRHGTAQRGERHGMAALTDADVATIRERRDRGESLLSIAEYFKTTEAQISRVVLGKSWSHVPGPLAVGDSRRGKKLTDGQVREILSLRGSGQYQRVIGERYGITQAMVSYIWKGHRMLKSRLRQDSD